MTFLMPLEIRGLGSQDVESLPSYLHRLADAHEVSVSALIKYTAEWFYKKYPDKQLFQYQSKPNSQGDISVFVRPNEVTASLVEILTEATGNLDIKGTTFLALHGALDRSSSVFSKQVRWCHHQPVDDTPEQDPGNEAPII